MSPHASRQRIPGLGVVDLRPSVVVARWVTRWVARLGRMWRCCSLFCGLALSSLSAHADVHGDAKPRRELILAGGALGICSSLSPRHCAPGADLQGVPSREAPRYSLAPDVVGARFETALDPLLWRGQQTQRRALAAVLTDLRAAFGAQSLSEDALRAALDTRCIGKLGRVRTCRGAERPPWLRLNDAQQGALLAGLELAQTLDDGRRRRERVALDQGRTPHGAAILRAFVAAARRRADRDAAQGSPDGRPRVVVVTASAFDPFEPVDFYREALTQAGAEVEWWPVDAALAAAVFGRDGAPAQGCAALDALRRRHLQLPARTRIYPDLVAEQRRACADPERLRTLPARVHGVFFIGGDQWRLRRAFVMGDAGEARDAPNPWLLALRAAVAEGRVVVGGTSAGSAVLSGGPMLSNGSSRAALRGGAIASSPPASGCTRSGDCVGGRDEDAFTYWRDGGLGLAPEMVIDTHFSERARELRLLRLLADTGTRWGFGVDEASALHLRWQADGSVRVDALGAGGGWVFDASSPACSGDALRVRAWQVDGVTVRSLRLSANGLQHATRGSSAIDAIAGPGETAADDALQGGHLRAAMRRLQSEAAQAPEGERVPADGIALRADDITVTLTRGADPDAPPTLRAAPWPGCR